VPLYEYECDACGQRFEIIQKFSDPTPEACKRCGKGPVHRLLSSPAIQFKGSGFYITDYPKKGTSDPSASTPAGKTGDSTKSDSKADSGATKSDAAKSDSTKSDTGSSAAKPSSGSSKDSKE
jgi:putative FmdB family regulatory protein